jgi:hypothetical protein
MPDHKNLMAVASTEMQSIIDAAGPTVEDKMRASMISIQDHWLLTNKDEQLKVSIAAVLQYCSDRDRKEDCDRIRWELEIISVIFGLSREKNILDLDMDKYQPIGMMRIWKEVVK